MARGAEETTTAAPKVGQLLRRKVKIDDEPSNLEEADPSDKNEESSPKTKEDITVPARLEKALNQHLLDNEWSQYAGDEELDRFAEGHNKYPRLEVDKDDMTTIVMVQEEFEGRRVEMKSTTAIEDLIKSVSSETELNEAVIQYLLQLQMQSSTNVNNAITLDRCQSFF